MIACRASHIFVLGALLIAGCGSSAGDVSEERLAKMAGGELKYVVPVSGKVLVDGAPKEGVDLFLYPSDGGKRITECRTDADGAYCWTTHTECDGLPPGKYRLAFEYVAKRRRNEKGTDEFGGRYKDPTKVEFLLTVEDGPPQENVDYELSTK